MPITIRPCASWTTAATPTRTTGARGVMVRRLSTWWLTLLSVVVLCFLCFFAYVVGGFTCRDSEDSICAWFLHRLFSHFIRNLLLLPVPLFPFRIPIFTYFLATGHILLPLVSPHSSLLSSFHVPCPGGCQNISSRLLRTSDSIGQHLYKTLPTWLP